MINTFKARLERLIERTLHAKETIEKESVIYNFDELLMDVFILVNESTEKGGGIDFIKQLQSLELEVAKEREAANSKLFSFY